MVTDHHASQSQGEEFNSWLSSTPYTGPVGVIVKLYVKQVLKRDKIFEFIKVQWLCTYTFRNYVNHFCKECRPRWPALSLR